MPEIARQIEGMTPHIPEVVTTPELIENKERTAFEGEKRQEQTQDIVETQNVVDTSESSTSTALVAPTVKSPVRRTIEKVLEEDLKLLYLELDTDRQRIFRQQGELTASRIEYLIGHAQLSIGYLVYLIRRWLLLLPGVNQYFIEQESKIKAEKILFLNAKE